MLWHAWFQNSAVKARLNLKDRLRIFLKAIPIAINHFARRAQHSLNFKGRSSPTFHSGHVNHEECQCRIFQFFFSL